MNDAIRHALATASMARTPFELRHFVAGRHVHPMQQYRQLVVELQIADAAIKRCEIGRRKRALQVAKLRAEAEALRATDDLAAGIKDCEAEESILSGDEEARALAGKKKEVEVICRLLETEYAEWLGQSEEKQLEHERSYWCHRLARQAAIDVASTGFVGAGNMEAIRQLPEQERIEVMKLSLLDDLEWNRWLGRRKHEALVEASREDQFTPIPYTPVPAEFVAMKLRKDAPPGYPEDRIADTGRIDIVIGTLHRNIATDTSASGGFEIPAGKNFLTLREECPAPELIGEYKYRLALHAESLGATHLFVLDDDIVAPANTIRRLYAHRLPIVGGWYPFKRDPPDSTSMLLVDGKPEPAPDGDGPLEVDWSLAAGCTLYEIASLKKLPRPWFKTTAKCTEDTFLTTLAAKHGVGSFLDRSLKVGHVDKATGKVFRLT